LIQTQIRNKIQLNGLDPETAAAAVLNELNGLMVPDVDEIPARNIQRMNELGRDRLRALLEACFNGAGGGEPGDPPAEGEHAPGETPWTR